MKEINDLIFKELLKRGYKLEGKTRVWDLADSKLWYITPKQSQGFLDLERNKEYKKSIINKEGELIKDNFNLIIDYLRFKSCNLVDLGCGDGKKAVLFIERLKNKINLRYCPIDISSYMVKRAVETIRQLNIGVVEFKWNISDFENLANITPLLINNQFNNNFMLLLGNTLGNFDREEMLNGIAKSMKKGDVILIGNGLKPNSSDDLVKPYQNQLIDSFLINVIKQIGLKENEVSYGTRFVNSRVEIIYTLLIDKKISYLSKEVDFKKGDIIVTAISYKYSKDTLKKVLSKFFRDVKIMTDKQEVYALALCRK